MKNKLYTGKKRFRDGYSSLVFFNYFDEFFFVSGKVTELMRQTKPSLDLLPQNQVKMDDNFKNLKVLRKKNNQTIYEIYHLSCYGWQWGKLERQIDDIREIVRTFTQPHAL